MREAFLDALPPDAPGQDPRAHRLPVRRPRGAAHVRRADGASARAGDGRVLPEHGRGHAEHLAGGARALPRHARRAEPDDRAAGARRGHTTSTGSCSATATSFPDQPKTLDELLENMARRMAAMSRLMASLSPEQRAELRGAGRTGDAGHGPRVRGEPAGREPRRRVPGDAVGRSGDGRRRGARPCRCRRRSTRWSACTTTRTSTGRCGGLRRAPSLEDVDEDARAPHPRRARRPRPPAAEGDRARPGAGRAGRAATTAASRSRRGARASWASGRWCRCSRSCGATAKGTHEARDSGGMAEPTGADPAVAVR